MSRKTTNNTINPVGGRQLNLVRETEELAKSLGFKIYTDDYNRICLYPNRNLPLIVFGKNNLIARYDDIKDLKYWLRGWEKLESFVTEKTMLTLDDIKDSTRQREILEKLQNKDSDEIE